MILRAACAHADEDSRGARTFIAGTALACVIAYWGWQLFGPAVARIPTWGRASRCNAHRCQSVQRFRSAPRRHRSRRAMRYSEATHACSASSPNRTSAGDALFRLPSGPKLVAQGQEIASGATFVSVQPDAVTIRDGAGERRFVLRSPTTAPVPVAGAGAPRRPRVRSDGCARQCRRHVRPTFRIPWNGGATQYRTAGRDRRGLRAMAYVARIHTRRPGRSRSQRLRRMSG